MLGAEPRVLLLLLLESRENCRNVSNEFEALLGLPGKGLVLKLERLEKFFPNTLLA